LLLGDERGIKITRKQAEDELRKLSEVVKQSPMHIVITDPKGKIEYVNPAFLEVTGFSLEEVLGRNPKILQSGESPISLYKDLWKTILTGNTWRGEFKNRKKDGTFFWENATVSPSVNPNGVITHFIGINEDITERKRAEEVMKKSAIIIDSTTDAVITTDVAGNITFWNKGAERIYGYQKSEVLGKPVNVLYKEKDLPVLSSMISDIMRGNVIPGIELTCFGKDHKEIEVLLSLTTIKDKDGNIIELVGITKDITERKKAGEALRKSEEKFKFLIQGLPDAIFVSEINGKNRGRIIDINPAAEKQTGYSREELIGMNITEDLIIEFDKSNFELYENKLLQGETISITEQKRRKNRSAYWVQVQITAIEYGGRKVALSVNRDITDLKKAEQELAKHREHLEELVKERTKALEDKTNQLEEFNKVMLDRELRIIEMKEEVNELYDELGREIKYPPVWGKREKE